MTTWIQYKTTVIFSCNGEEVAVEIVTSEDAGDMSFKEFSEACKTALTEAGHKGRWDLQERLPSRVFQMIADDAIAVVNL